MEKPKAEDALPSGKKRAHTGGGREPSKRLTAVRGHPRKRADENKHEHQNEEGEEKKYQEIRGKVAAKSVKDLGVNYFQVLGTLISRKNSNN